jgi:hypothetical protein
MVVHIHPCLALVVDARVLQLLMPVFFSLGRSLWLMLVFFNLCPFSTRCSRRPVFGIHIRDPRIQ